MAKIAFFNMPALGHVNPTLDICASLVKRGHEVIYLCTEDFRVNVEATGARVIAYESHQWSGSVPMNPNPGEFLTRMMRDSIAVTKLLLEKLRSEKIDLAIYDCMTIWGKTFAMALKVPAIKFHPTHVMRGSLEKGEVGPWAAIFEPGFLQAEIAELAQDSKLPNINLAEVWFGREKLNLVTVPKEFQVGGQNFGPEYLFVGPSIFSRDADLPFPMERLKDKKAIFISLGTVFNSWVDFFKLCFKAFADRTDFVFVMTTGKGLTLEALGPVPENFILSAYVPQLKIFPRTAAAICHGGMNTTMEAIAAGVPQVIIPQMPEQQITAQRIADLGLGVHLDKAEVTVESLQKALAQVLGNAEIPAHLLAMQSAIRAAGGTARAVKAIEDYLV